MEQQPLQTKHQCKPQRMLQSLFLVAGTSMFLKFLSLLSPLSECLFYSGAHTHINTNTHVRMHVHLPTHAHQLKPKINTSSAQTHHSQVFFRVNWVESRPSECTDIEGTLISLIFPTALQCGPGSRETGGPVLHTASAGAGSKAGGWNNLKAGCLMSGGW